MERGGVEEVKGLAGGGGEEDGSDMGEKGGAE